MSGLAEKNMRNDDSEIWDAFRAGNEKSFTHIYNQYVEDLYRYGLKFYNHPHDVKDCIQDLFIKLYNNRANLGSTDNIQLYLFRALKNRLIDLYYSQRSSVSVDEIPFEIMGEDGIELGEDWNDIVKRKKLQKGMEALTARQKEAIYLRFTKEMQLEEISSLLDMNYQSVRNLIYRSIEKLRKELLIGAVLLLAEIFN